MAVHHVLCVHGIGKHTTTWIDSDDDGNVSFDATLRALWGKYPSLAKNGIDQVVKLHSVCYDDEISKLLKNWKDQVKTIKDTLGSSELLAGETDWFTGVLDSAQADANPDKEDWRWTHLADLLLILGSPSIQDALVNHIVKQMTGLIRGWAADEGGLPQVSIVCHSAGTAMTHKALQALYNEKVDGEKLGPHFQFKLICNVANTSFTLSRDRKNHYKGWVRPSLSVGEGACTRWINVNHRLDPVGRFQPFDYRAETGWLDPAVEMRNWHRDILLSSLSSENVHSINHYFRDPRLHVPFFELLVGARFTQKELEQAQEDFDDTTVDGKLKSLRTHLEALDPRDRAAFKEWFASLRAFIKLVGQYT